MPIQLECDACGRRVKVKDEHAGRKIRCPGCEEPIKVPAARDDFEMDFEEEEFEERPSKSRSQAAAKSNKRPGKKSQANAEAPWFRRYWYLLTAGAMLLLALIPKAGLVIAGLIAFLGVGMVFVGGIAPFLKVFFGAPGTVIAMILSTRARFEMMNAPDSHPYKRLVRTAFDPWRGLFWKGVLLIVMFIPAAVINVNIPDFYKKFAGDDPQPAPNPNLIGPGRQPGVNPGQPNPNPMIGGNPNPDPAQGRGFQPGQNQPANPGGSGQVFNYTIQYDEFTGEGTVKDAALAALKIHPDFPEDTLKVDEETKTIQFQYKVRIGPPALSGLFGQRGFRKLSIQMSSE